MVEFLKELLQTPDKFKAGATSLEVIHNIHKYIPEKYYRTLDKLELEDMISYAEGAGNFRYDIKWSAELTIGSGQAKRISILIDTKNYGSVSNMFKNLKQFKAYLREIDNFDQMYIIQQGGRGITKEKRKKRLRNVLNKDDNIEEVFDVIWKNEALRENVFGELKREKALKQFSENIKDDNYEMFNSILTTV